MLLPKGVTVALSFEVIVLENALLAALLAGADHHEAQLETTLHATGRLARGTQWETTARTRRPVILPRTCNS